VTRWVPRTALVSLRFSEYSHPQMVAAEPGKHGHGIRFLPVASILAVVCDSPATVAECPVTLVLRPPVRGRRERRSAAPRPRTPESSVAGEQSSEPSTPPRPHTQRHFPAGRPEYGHPVRASPTRHSGTRRTSGLVLASMQH